MPSRRGESSDSAKRVGDKSYSDSLSCACCIKVGRVVGCLISCQNCWSSRPLRLELRGLSSPPHPLDEEKKFFSFMFFFFLIFLFISFLLSFLYFFLPYQYIYLFTLYYDGVTNLRCHKGVFPHTQAWESPQSQHTLTHWRLKKYCKLPNLRSCPSKFRIRTGFPQALWGPSWGCKRKILQELLLWHPCLLGTATSALLSQLLTQV